MTRFHLCPHCNVPLKTQNSAICPTCGKPTAVATTEAGWFYAREGQPIGPVSSAQLRALAAAGALCPTDLILKAGTGKWVPAAKVKKLFPVAVPPPIPSPEPVPAPCHPAQVRDPFLSRHEALAEAQVVPEPGRCVQCGICSYNCPMEIDVRAHAWRGQPIHDSHCLTCSECVNRCPRGVLRFERISLFMVPG